MSIDPNAAPLPSRYVVGIDLGTTNSAVAYVDTSETSWRCRTFPVPQLVATGQVEARETLPSFHYQPTAGEVSAGTLKLPWQRSNPSHVVGVFARDFGSQAIGRTIASAKSWLCHAAVDRTADILPWHGAEDVDRISPVAACSRYLKHIRDAWNHQHRNDPLESQDLAITLPASFDEVARELTVEAAAKAGLSRVFLIEEPQAAFYAWLHKHSQNWESLVAPGQKILVCDIGGGTSDFTLIRVRGGERGKVQFHRVAVGEHLILGGDNLDLALAHHVEGKLNQQGKLDPRQWETLIRVCRQTKESLLGPNPPEQATIALAGTGSKLIGGGLSTKTTRAEVESVLLDGFLPRVPLDAVPQSRRSGFQEFGLPYAPDPAITKYLAQFLSVHRHAGDDATTTAPTDIDPARPDIVLFNGGMFESPAMKARLIEVLSSWFSAVGKPWQPMVLDNERLDLAVAHGAAYYGMVRRGEGVKITANLARSYYLGVDSEPPSAICVLPGFAEPGQEFTIANRPLEMLISEPVEFPLYSSSLRLADQPGELITVDPQQMSALPPIRTAMRTQRKSDRGTLQVHIQAKLSEIGTLELWCAEASGTRRWRLQFDVRSATQTEMDAVQTSGEAAGVLDEEAWNAAAAVLESTFGEASTQTPETLPKRLAEALAIERSQWPPSLLRRIWEKLIELEAGRKKSPLHEARWLNLLGFALRPGYGMAVDDWRVSESWRLVQGKLAHSAATSRTESLILWRRIGGGLTSGQQKALAEPLLAPIKALHKRNAGTGGGKVVETNLSPHETVEILRLLGSLELLPSRTKSDLGGMLLDLLPKRKLETLRGPILWAIGRLGARMPLYGPLNVALSPEVAANWAKKVTEFVEADAALGEANQSMALWSIVQLARKTGDRHRDIAQSSRDQLVEWLTWQKASDEQIELVKAGGQLDLAAQSQAFGESLPKGLRLRT